MYTKFSPTQMARSHLEWIGFAPVVGNEHLFVVFVGVVLGCFLLLQVCEFTAASSTSSGMTSSCVACQSVVLVALVIVAIGLKIAMVVSVCNSKNRLKLHKNHQQHVISAIRQLPLSVDVIKCTQWLQCIVANQQILGTRFNHFSKHAKNEKHMHLRNYTRCGYLKNSNVTHHRVARVYRTCNVSWTTFTRFQWDVEFDSAEQNA